MKCRICQTTNLDGGTFVHYYDVADKPFETAVPFETNYYCEYCADRLAQIEDVVANIVKQSIKTMVKDVTGAG